jgi:hypothetical protein
MNRPNFNGIERPLTIRGESRDAFEMGLRNLMDIVNRSIRENTMYRREITIIKEKIAILKQKQFIKGTAVKDADRCEKRKMGAAIFSEEARN